MADFSKLIDLASERLGAAALLASDDFFAPKENLVRAPDPIWRADAYTENGKWMDGWESRRKRTPGHDWAIVRLGVPGVLRGVTVDTAFFTGNFPERCAIDAAYVTGNESPEELVATADWTEVLPETPLDGDAENVFSLSSPVVASHVRLRIYPDGGVARLRVYGEPLPEPRRLRPDAELNLAAMELGARALGCSDDHYGKPNNLLQPGRAPNMGDGWETKRRRGPGHDWATICLALAGRVTRLVLDTEHNKGNYPDRADVQAAVSSDTECVDEAAWFTLLPSQKLQAHTAHGFTAELMEHEFVTHLRLRIYPDGGVSRMRVYGVPTAEAIAGVQLAWLNALPSTTAAEALLTCCGSSTWVQGMLRARPFASAADVLAAADSVASALEPADWLEAFAAHPPIGGRHADRGTGEQAAKWSAGEQASVANAAEETLRDLASLNERYAERYGFIFIICATAKSADEMRAALSERLSNDRDTELQIAAVEQRKITALRLHKYLRT